MRAKYFSFTPAAVSTTGIASGLTGAGPFTTFNAITDGLAHRISLTSTANLSAIDITLTGTDADGRVISETRAGPNNNTVSTTAYFKSITTIVASSTLSTNTMNVGWTDKFVSQTIPLDTYAARPATISLTIGGTIEVDLQDTNSKIRDGSIQSSWTWLTDANFDNVTASVGGQLTSTGLTAMRLVANSYSTGATVNLALTQSR